MSVEAEAVQWYYQDDIERTVREATHDWNASTEKIVDVLARRELDAPRDRIRSMVEVAIENLEEPKAQESDGSEADSPIKPRSMDARVLDVEDANYLDDRALATVVGAALSRYEGTFSIPEPTDNAAVDVFWNRQHTSIAFHTIAAPNDDPVDEDDVRAVVDSDTEPETGRTPSTVGIATTASFTESAVALAEANDIELFGEPHIDRWLRHAGLSRGVAGPLLEENELTVEEIDDLLADLPPIPESAQLMDPLGDVQSESTSVTVTSKDVVPDVDTRIPVTDEPSPQGKKGELYADPGEDGDFGAFDRFVDGLDENEAPE